jgi:hypothetical protein
MIAESPDVNHRISDNGYTRLAILIFAAERAR